MSGQTARDPLFSDRATITWRPRRFWRGHMRPPWREFTYGPERDDAAGVRPRRMLAEAGFAIERA